METGKKAPLKGGHVHFWLSDLSSVKRGGGASLLPPPPTHTALASARPAQGLARRLRAASQRGCSVRRDRAEGPGVTAPLHPPDTPLPPLRGKEGGSKRAQSRAAAVAGNEKRFHSSLPSLRGRGRRERGERRNRPMCHRRQRPPSLLRAGGEQPPAPHTPSAPRPLPTGGGRAWASPQPFAFPTAQVPAAPGVCRDPVCLPRPTPGQSPAAPAPSEGNLSGQPVR